MAIGKQLGQREQILVCVGFVAVAIAVFYWYKPYRGKAAELDLKQQRIDAIVASNQKAQAELAGRNLEQLRAQLAQYQRNLEAIRTLVPQSNEVPALLEQVSTAARKVGLDLAEVDPDPVVPGPEYDTYRYKIGLVGGYHDLAVFLTNVGSLTRIVAPVNMQLTQPGNPSAAKAKQKREDESMIQARFQIQTYVAKTMLDKELEKSRDALKLGAN
jgi:type IV pilus assembly protein PilO